MNMRAIMTASECIQEAKRCEDMAAVVCDPALQRRLIDISLTWREMAEHSSGAKFLVKEFRQESHC